MSNSQLRIRKRIQLQNSTEIQEEETKLDLDK